MNAIQQISHYGDTHHPKWLDIARIGLGLILLVKGVQFISDIGALQQIVLNSRFPWLSFYIAHYVALAHLVGGILIALGLMTRIAILFQLPVLAGALIFVHSWRGFFVQGSELLFAIIVLALLLFFLVYGSGPLSLDAKIYQDKK